MGCSDFDPPCRSAISPGHTKNRRATALHAGWNGNGPHGGAARGKSVRY
jgi:hypothetical protein